MSNINLEHGAIGRSIVTAGTTENQNAAMAAYRASRTKSRSSVTGAPASSPSEAEEKTSSATVPLELAPSVEGFKSGAPASSPSEAEEKTSSATVPLELAPSVEGFKSGAAAPPLTVSRGRGFRGESRGRGFRGESRGSREFKKIEVAENINKLIVLKIFKKFFDEKNIEISKQEKDDKKTEITKEIIDEFKKIFLLE